MLMMAKTTALQLALMSALLSVLFAYLHVYSCLVASFLLLVIFDSIWAAKVERDRRLSKLHHTIVPEPPIVKTNTNSQHLVIPQSFD